MTARVPETGRPVAGNGRVSLPALVVLAVPRLEPPQDVEVAGHLRAGGEARVAKVGPGGVVLLAPDMRAALPARPFVGESGAADRVVGGGQAVHAPDHAVTDVIRTYDPLTFYVGKGVPLAREVGVGELPADGLGEREPCRRPRGNRRGDSRGVGRGDPGRGCALGATTGRDAESRHHTPQRQGGLRRCG